MKGKKHTNSELEMTVSKNSNLNPPDKLINGKDLKSYLEVDFILQEEIFDHYVKKPKKPKKLNREIKTQILKIFTVLSFGL